MSRLRGLAALVRATVGRRAAERRMEEEFRFHLDMETERHLRAGMTPDAARRAAERSFAPFGDADGHREALRHGRGGRLDDVGRDLRIAWRSLRATPGFTLAAVSSLALGLALTATALAVGNAYLVRALPFPHAERLHHVMYAPPGPEEPHGMSRIDWSALGDVVDAPIRSSGVTYYFDGGAYAQSARGIRLSQAAVAALGVRTVVGRSLVADDFAPGAEPVALVGQSLWRERFGADRGVVGRTLRVQVEGRDGGEATFRVVGVLTPGFWVGRDSRATIDVLTPVSPRERPATVYLVRLRAGVPVAHAERRLTDAARAVATWMPSDWPGVRLESAHARYVEGLRPTLVAVAAAASLVLAIACVNVAVLMLLRTLRRQRDLAVRVVLGARRTSLLGMYALEIGLLFAAALAVGVALTAVALRALAPLVEEQLGKPAPGGAAAIAVDGTVLGAVLGVCVLAALGVASIPLLVPWRHRLAGTLRGASRAGTEGRTMRRLRTTLVAAEIAGSLALLAGCGLMIRSAAGMLGTDLGFRAEGLVRARVVLRGASYPDQAAYQRFYEAFARQVAASGATPVFTSWPPYVDAPTQMVTADGRAGEVAAGVVAVGPAYFRTLAIPLRAGRGVTASDRRESEPVALVSESLARRLWPGRSALGRRVRPIEREDPGAPPSPWRTVVGVVADVRQTYDDGDRHDVYVPYLQYALLGRYGSFHLRGAPSPTLTRALRAAAAAVDPQAVVDEPRVVAAENRRLSRARFMTSLLTGFAAFAALLAVLGIYGVVAYAAQQREREVAIRLAVGASPPAVVRLFVRDAWRVLAAGIGAGVVASIAVARLLEAQLFGVTPSDPTTLAAAALVMAAAALGATWWPARRAARRSPAAALQES